MSENVLFLGVIACTSTESVDQCRFGQSGEHQSDNLFLFTGSEVC